MHDRTRTARLIGGFVFLWLLTLQIACASKAAELTALSHQLWDNDQDVIQFLEPSGIVFHASRGTLFIVGDEGDLAEYDTGGTLIAATTIRNLDLEGITYNPQTGLVYAVVEDSKKIMEVDPKTLEPGRIFLIDRELNGRSVIANGKNGIEGITFVPDSAHPEGGLFFLASQGTKENNGNSVLIAVEAALNSNQAALQEAPIVAVYEPGLPDLSGLHYDKENHRLYAISDKLDSLYLLTMSGKVLEQYPLPGHRQEGIAIDNDNFIYITDDSGEIIKLK